MSSIVVLLFNCVEISRYIYIYRSFDIYTCYLARVNGERDWLICGQEFKQNAS